MLRSLTPRHGAALVILSVVLAGAACETDSARSTATTAATAATAATSSTGAAGQTQCGSIAFEENSDNIASDIVADGVSCNEAKRLVRTVADTHNFYSGPRSFTTDDGYRCTVVTKNEGLLVGSYTCVTDGRTVRWNQT